MSVDESLRADPELLLCLPGSGAPGSDGAEVAFSAEEGADGSAAAANRRQFAAFIGGLSDEEIEASLLCLLGRIWLVILWGPRPHT